MHTENENIIGKRMRELRGDMSQRQAASCVGMWAQNWNVYESGQSVPGAQAIINICQYFNVSADWLLGLSNERAAAKVAAPIQSPRSTVRNSSSRAAVLAPQSDSDILEEIRALKARVAALESQPAFACG